MTAPLPTLQKNRFWIFLASLSIMVIILGWVITSRYGAGISSDSAKYLSVAQNLLAGHGLVDLNGLPLIAWPPLYSLLLAGWAFIMQLDVFVAGWYLNLLLLGLNLFLSGLIFQRIFTDEPLYAYLSTAFVFLSISSLRIHATIGSDAFYLTLTLAFLLVVDDYVKHGSRSAFIWMVVFSALAPMQRYVGMSVCVTALFVLVIQNRKSLKQMLRSGLVLGLVSFLPIFWWLVIHNLMTYGSMWGTTNDQVVDVIQNIELALTKMLHWFIPYLTPIMPLLTRPFIVLGAIGLILILINIRTRRNWLDLFHTLTAPSTYPTMVYASVYFAAVAANIVTADHRYLFSDRYYVILLVPTMVLVWLVYHHLIRPYLRFTSRQLGFGLIALFVLWSVYPLYGLREYVAKALEQGEPSDYNLFNTRAYHEMNVVAAMQKLRVDHPGVIVYSNYSDAVWFYTRESVLPLPTRTVPTLDAYNGWPGGSPGYIVWFKPNEYKHYLSPEELTQFASLELLYSDESGDIYHVQSR